MEDAVEKLRRIGLTEYEGRAYLALLGSQMSMVVSVSKKFGVPRTKTYAVLESLGRKGWVKIYPGVPLLFKALDPRVVFDQMRSDFAAFLESIQTELDKKVGNMKEKLVMKKFDIGLGALKEDIRNARTVEINNATASFIDSVESAFDRNAVVRVLLFPGESMAKTRNVERKQAEVAIMSIVRNREVPSMSVILDESRTFTVFRDPVDGKYIVDEMLYDECSKCFSEWNGLSWGSAKEA
jgi:sugar-specific transcriptional regulator TrmB